MRAMWTMMAGSLLTLVTFGAGFLCGGLLAYDAGVDYASRKKAKTAEEGKV
ncbi:MAG: hypothetical protein IJ899_03310 [Blautia sp.]|nr:hypothetical protein [Blautia sp.]